MVSIDQRLLLSVRRLESRWHDPPDALAHPSGRHRRAGCWSGWRSASRAARGPRHCAACSASAAGLALAVSQLAQAALLPARARAAGIGGFAALAENPDAFSFPSGHTAAAFARGRRPSPARARPRRRSPSGSPPASASRASISAPTIRWMWPRACWSAPLARPGGPAPRLLQDRSSEASRLRPLAALDRSSPRSRWATATCAPRQALADGASARAVAPRSTGRRSPGPRSCGSGGPRGASTRSPRGPRRCRSWARRCARVLDSLTAIPHLHPQRDLSAPDAPGALARPADPRAASAAASRTHLRATGAPLAHHLLRPRHHRRPPRLRAGLTAWSPTSTSTAPGCRCAPERTRIVYLPPSRRAVQRLRAYGVPREQIELHRLPAAARAARRAGAAASCARNLAGRLVRLDRKGVFRAARRATRSTHFLGELPADEEGRPPLAHLRRRRGRRAGRARAAAACRASRRLIEEGRLRLCLSPGVRAEVADRFHDGSRSRARAPPRRRRRDPLDARLRRATSRASTRSSPRPTSCGPSRAR